MTPEQRIEKIDWLLAQLSEHFDAVQVLTSWSEQCETRSIFRGAGNWHARQGMAHEFINKDVAQEHAFAMRSADTPPPDNDDSEAWKQQ
jgi:hypothetical protein